MSSKWLLAASAYFLVSPTLCSADDELLDEIAGLLEWVDTSYFKVSRNTDIRYEFHLCTHGQYWGVTNAQGKEGYFFSEGAEVPEKKACMGTLSLSQLSLHPGRLLESTDSRNKCPIWSGDETALCYRASGIKVQKKPEQLCIPLQRNPLLEEGDNTSIATKVMSSIGYLATLCIIGLLTCICCQSIT